MNECICVELGDGVPTFECGAFLRSKTEQEAVKKCNNYGIVPAKSMLDPNVSAMFMCKYFKRDGIGVCARWRCRYVEDDGWPAWPRRCTCASAREDALITSKLETL